MDNQQHPSEADEAKWREDYVTDFGKKPIYDPYDKDSVEDFIDWNAGLFGYLAGRRAQAAANAGGEAMAAVVRAAIEEGIRRLEHWREWAKADTHEDREVLWNLREAIYLITTPPAPTAASAVPDAHWQAARRWEAIEAAWMLGGIGISVQENGAFRVDVEPAEANGFVLLGNSAKQVIDKLADRLLAAAPQPPASEPDRVRVLEQALRGLLDIVKDSQGVVGYHLNGNVAAWDEFEEVDVACHALAGKSA